ncbi:hypothetical protein [Polaromonas sp. CG9_12]|uniref:hypothetical protein n=1 Tax=Polaromonas sp. CG_9.11 TaxID=2787730 RepID=UPI0004DDD89F|nr:hypothetical protein [Polaromonas sp. CG_9.11]MBG6074574.1 hypothetical protein [Polaromonas sp. CG_9.11]CDS53466.1 hypothetical protein [Polaromonas sp. CG9_12]
MRHQLFFKGSTAVALALALGACGDGGTVVGGGGGQTPDSFIAAVNAVIANTSETLEPREIESISVTSPEDTEPAALSS